MKKVLARSSEVAQFLSQPITHGSYDLECTGLNPRMDNIVGIGVYNNADDTAYYFPVAHITMNANNITRDEAIQVIQHCMTAKRLWMWNMGFDIEFTDEFCGLRLDPVTKDAQAVVWNQEVDERLPALKVMAKKHLDVEMTEFMDLVSGGRIDMITPEDAMDYATDDVIYTYILGEMFYQKVEHISDFMVDLDMNTHLSVLDITRKGHPINSALLAGRIAKQTEKTNRFLENCHILAGFPISPNSPAQVGRVLIKLGLDIHLPKTKKRGIVSTKYEHIKPLQSQSEFVDNLIKYRQSNKLTEYYENVQKSLLNNRIHTKYFSYIAPTGRLATGSEKKGKSYVAAMNIQSSPKPPSWMWNVVDHPVEGELVVRIFDWYFVPFKDKNTPAIEGAPVIEGMKPENFRELFTAEEGDLFVSVDFSAQELRIAASLSRESVWIKAFNSGIDIHEAVGKSVFGDSAYNKDVRKITKIMNFALLYLGTWYNVFQQINLSGIKIVSRQEAQQYVRSYERGLPILYAWKDKEIQRAHRSGYVRTYFGRYRSLRRWLKNRDMKKVAFGERSVINTQVQGTAGDLMRLSLARCNAIPDFYTYVTAILSSIHDELNFSVSPRNIIPALNRIWNAMLFDIVGFDVQMDLSVEIGPSWGCMFPFVFEAS